MPIAHVYVTLKPTLFDPQGATGKRALHQLNHTMVHEARIGKYIMLQLDDTLTGPELQHRLNLMCQQLLSNPVIENYEIVLDDGALAVTSAAPTPEEAAIAISAEPPPTASPAATP